MSGRLQHAIIGEDTSLPAGAGRADGVTAVQPSHIDMEPAPGASLACHVATVLLIENSHESAQTFSSRKTPRLGRKPIIGRYYRRDEL